MHAHDKIRLSYYMRQRVYNQLYMTLRFSFVTLTIYVNNNFVWFLNMIPLKHENIATDMF